MSKPSQLSMSLLPTQEEAETSPKLPTSASPNDHPQSTHLTKLTGGTGMSTTDAVILVKVH